MSAGCTVLCSKCGHSMRIEIAEIDKLRRDLATMTADRDRWRAKATAAETLARKSTEDPFGIGSVFGGHL